MSYDFELKLLIFFLALLIVLKLIFRISSKKPKKNKAKKEESLVKVDAKDYGDASGIAETEELTTYLVNDKSNSNYYNKDENLGNYMQDILVLNEENPNKLVGINSYNENKITNNNEIENSINELNKTNEFVEQKRNQPLIYRRIDDDVSNDISKEDLKAMEEMIRLDSNSSKNDEFMREYKGLSREMKIYLISKILERKHNKNFY